MNLHDQKAQLLRILNQQDFEAAEKIVLTMQKQDSDHEASLYAAAIFYLAVGNFENSIEFFQSLLKKTPADAVALCNLGNAYLGCQRTEEALDVFKKAIKIDKNYEAAHYNLSCALIANHQPEKALKTLMLLVKKNPTVARYYCAQGDAFRLQGDWRRARERYEKTIALDENFVQAHNNLTPIFSHFGEKEKSLEHGRKTVELNPGEVLGYRNLGDALVVQERFEEAMDVYADGFEVDASFNPLLASIGKSWVIQGEVDEAASWFQKILDAEPDNLEGIAGLANVMKERDDPEGGLSLLMPHVDAAQQDADFLSTLAECYWDEGDADAAIEVFNKIKILQPQRAGIHARIGQIYSSSGKMDKAKLSYEEALQQNPRCIPAINGLVTSLRHKCDPKIIDVAELILNNDNLDDGTVSSLSNALAYYYDGLKESKKAAEYMRSANQYQWKRQKIRGWKYDPKDNKQYTSDTINAFSKDFFSRHYGSGNSSCTPVFIVGMPRSGTTLTEQILARHSQVLGVGERPYVTRSLGVFKQFLNENKIGLQPGLMELHPQTIDDISAEHLGYLNNLVEKSEKNGVLRVVDKMPDNYSQLGWIVTLFPNAKIIHCKRDVRDVALSQWQTQFGAIRFANHTDHIVERFREYQRIMQHWRETLPVEILEIDYEETISNQEQVSKKMFEWLGLDWEEECLKFYDSDRLVRTASISQVRQPIYKTSVQKWKRYEPYLADLFDPLAELNHK
jgi:tetratricopeptide (TPR) repeat protein